MRVGVSAMWLHSGLDAKNSGLSRYAQALIDAMLETPDCPDLEIFAPGDFDPPAAWRSNRKCRLHRVRFRGLPQRVFWEHFTAGRIARKIKVDLWFSMAQSIPFGHGLRRVAMVHDAIPILFPEHHPKRTVAYYWFVLKYTCKNADLILANSNATCSDLVRLFSAERSKIRITPLGPGNRVEPRNPSSVRKEELESIGVPFERYLLTLSTLDPRKNLEGLVRAFAIWRQGNPDSDLGLVVVGAKRPTFDDSLFQLVRNLGLEGKIAIPGYLPDKDLPALFARAELFVFPSLYEGFGLPVLEAMLLGAPVVCSATSSLPEVGGDEVVYFDPSKPEEIAAGISKGLSRLSDREAWVKSGFERAKQFTWKRTAELTLAAFRDVADPHRMRPEATIQ